MSQSGSCDQHLGLWEGKPRHALAELQWAEARAAQENKPRHTERRGPRGAGEKNEVQICFPFVLPSFLRPHTPCHGFFMIIYSTSLQGLFFLQCFLSQNMFSNKRQTITHKQEGKQTSSFILSEGKRQKRTKNILVIYMQSPFPPESAADFRDAGCLLRGMDYKSYSCGLSLLLLL